jgi:hypothetical protein
MLSSCQVIGGPTPRPLSQNRCNLIQRCGGGFDLGDAYLVKVFSMADPSSPGSGGKSWERHQAPAFSRDDL